MGGASGGGACTCTGARFAAVRMWAPFPSRRGPWAWQLDCVSANASSAFHLPSGDSPWCPYMCLLVACGQTQPHTEGPQSLFLPASGQVHDALAKLGNRCP